MKTLCKLLSSSDVDCVLIDVVCRIFTCLLKWETGLIYLCEEGSKTSIWKLLSSHSPTEFSTYFAHCLEVNLIHSDIKFNK